jgi:tRNA splicing endonuclease
VECARELKRRGAYGNAKLGGEGAVLLLPEAFFLVTLGCMDIVDQLGEAMPPHLCWQVFCVAIKQFPILFAAYSYLRSNGWVPKPGISYGVDFLLYRRGPDFYHADYGVLVREKIAVPVDSNASAPPRLALPWDPLDSWTSLLSSMRMMTSVRKGLMVCTVTSPSPAFTAPERNFPQFIANATSLRNGVNLYEEGDVVVVAAVIVSRWCP